MNTVIRLVFLMLLSFQYGFGQQSQDEAILKFILTKQFANEKVIVKDRLQLLTLYCNKAPNNEEVNDVITTNAFLKKYEVEIKKQIIQTLDETWDKELTSLFTNQNQYLKSKVKNCMQFEDFQKKSNAAIDNKERLLIINKPIYFNQKFCLVRVAIYRNIEHNGGSFFYLENVNGNWIIKQILNKWET
jgi:hypothetical protein